MIHDLPLERANLHGHFSRDLPPALTVDPGDSVRIAIPNAGWYLGRETQFEPRSSPGGRKRGRRASSSTST